MKVLFKKAPLVSLIAASSLVSFCSVAATDSVLKVKTVEQVKLTEKKAIKLGTIPAAPGYECVVPQRLEAAITNDTTNTTTVLSNGTAPGSELCTDGTPGLFLFSGVPGQTVKVTFSADNSNADAVGTFQPEGIYAKYSWTNVTETVGLTELQTLTPAIAEGSDTGAARDALDDAIIQIFNSKDVELNDAGKGVLLVGGALKVSKSLMPDTEYYVNYIVNVVYQ